MSDSRWVINRDSFTPAYLKLYETDRSIFSDRVEEAYKVLRSCEVCPRDCRVNRMADEHGVCRIGRYAMISSASPHFGEEDCLRGWRGSGTIFFSFCNLKCVFCQNYDISWQGSGESVTAKDLAHIMISLQQRGCHNINFVTPEHVVPQIMESIPIAVEMGLRIPIVYNTSGYDSMHSLKLMDGIVDMYMPDFKFWDREFSKLYMAAEDYPDVARIALKEMHRQVGPLKIDAGGLALRGVLVRHLVMPDNAANSREILKFIARELSKDTFINIMDQYHPAGQVPGTPHKYGKINRSVTRKEYNDVINAAREEGLYRLDDRWR